MSLTQYTACGCLCEKIKQLKKAAQNMILQVFSCFLPSWKLIILLAQKVINRQYQKQVSSTRF